MSEEKPKEFWALDSENVPFKKGWYYRAFDLQVFMRTIEADPRGGEIIGMEFDGKNVEFYTKASPEQLQEAVVDGITSTVDELQKEGDKDDSK